jgi:hypothetical protein
MEQFQEFLKDLIQRIVEKDDIVPQALTYMQESDEDECKLVLSTLLDEEYDIVLDHLYSLLPSQQVEVINGNTIPLPPIHLN